MKKSLAHQSLSGFLFSVCLLVTAVTTVAPTNSLAQAVVVEAGGGTVLNQSQQINNAPLNNTPLPATAPNPANDNVVMNLYLQLEAVQEEVQTLRGIVEEQSYLINRMQKEQRDRYLDLDRRLSNNSTSLPNTSLVSTPIATTVIADVVPVTNDTIIPSSTTPTSTPVGEQDIYRTALNLLLEDSKYDESIVMFQNYIDGYPEGRFLTNAYYWQGEALILVDNYAQARDVFTRVITDFPEDAKAAGAMLKLGVAHNQMGNTDLAIQTWQRILSEYPDDLPVIRAADDYLRRNGN